MGRTDRASRVIEAPLIFQSILKIKMVTVQVNGNEMAWVCENHFGAESNTQTAYSIETFAWDDAGNRPCDVDQRFSGWLF